MAKISEERIRQIHIEKDDVVIINGKVTISLVAGSSALPVTHGSAIKISGNIEENPQGYSSGNSGYEFKEFRTDSVYVQPGIQIPHESQLPRCYIVAAGAMFWRVTHPITNENKVFEEEENAMYWKHGEIVYNEEDGESTFPEINETVVRLWQEVSYPLLQKQMKEIEMDSN